MWNGTLISTHEQARRRTIFEWPLETWTGEGKERHESKRLANTTPKDLVLMQWITLEKKRHMRTTEIQVESMRLSVLTGEPAPRLKEDMVRNGRG